MIEFTSKDFFVFKWVFLFLIESHFWEILIVLLDKKFFQSGHRYSVGHYPWSAMLIFRCSSVKRSIYNPPKAGQDCVGLFALTVDDFQWFSCLRDICSDGAWEDILQVGLFFYVHVHWDVLLAYRNDVLCEDLWKFWVFTGFSRPIVLVESQFYVSLSAHQTISNHLFNVWSTRSQKAALCWFTHSTGEILQSKEFVFPSSQINESFSFSFWHSDGQFSTLSSAISMSTRTLSTWSRYRIYL